MSNREAIGVYGGGRMGAGIAHAFLLADVDVIVVESSDEAVGAARDRIAESVRGSAKRGQLTGSAEEVLGRCAVVTDPSELDSASLVVEAVPEIIDVKTDVLASIERHAPQAVVASNTSSLSIDQLASGLARPERFIGLHFFNPVPASALVEVVVGARTAPEVVDRARAWVERIEKTSITVSDFPGFASSRLGVAIALEAMRMVEDGVASAEDIDVAMTLGYRHPVGPLRTTDIVGLDVRLAIAEYLAQEVGERFTPPQILRDMVERGDLGRKSGRGFYQW